MHGSPLGQLHNCAGRDAQDPIRSHWSPIDVDLVPVPLPSPAIAILIAQAHLTPAMLDRAADRVDAILSGWRGTTRATGQRLRPPGPVPEASFRAQISGRGERIRTFDLLNPIQVRYQTALRPDRFLLRMTT
jgi:hypothetical protein